MGNSCSCKGCVISCIDKYSDCKDYVNNEGKYSEKKPSDIKIVSSINIQNILKTITTNTVMKRNEEVPKTSLENKVIEPPLSINNEEFPNNDSKTEMLLVISDKTKNINNIKDPLVKNNKNSDDEFEII
jgi:hypothetical protein